MSWIVKWVDELDHDSGNTPREAVETALEAICLGQTVAFEVTNTETGETFKIDMDDDEDEGTLI